MNLVFLIPGVPRHRGLSTFLWNRRLVLCLIRVGNRRWQPYLSDSLRSARWQPLPSDWPRYLTLCKYERPASGLGHLTLMRLASSRGVLDEAECKRHHIRHYVFLLEYSVLEMVPSRTGSALLLDQAISESEPLLALWACPSPRRNQLWHPRSESARPVLFGDFHLKQYTHESSFLVEPKWRLRQGLDSL